MTTSIKLPVTPLMIQLMKGNDDLLTRVIGSSFEVEAEAIKSKTRQRKAVNARKCYLFIICIILAQGPTEAGKHIPCTHASVIYAVKQFENHFYMELDYRGKVMNVLNALNPNKQKEAQSIQMNEIQIAS